MENKPKYVYAHTLNPGDEFIYRGQTYRCERPDLHVLVGSEVYMGRDGRTTTPTSTLIERRVLRNLSYWAGVQLINPKTPEQRSWTC